MGFYFGTSEHAYQWVKCLLHGRFDLCQKILDSNVDINKASVWFVMKLGQGYKPTTNEWKDEDKYFWMLEICKAKYQACPSFRRSLFDSRNLPIKEETFHRYWGGKGSNCLNKLGMVHESIRGQSRSWEELGRPMPNPNFVPVAPGFSVYPGRVPVWEGVSVPFRRYLNQYMVQR